MKAQALFHYSTLNMEAAGFSETLAPIHGITVCHIPEQGNIQ
jgi:hypothetical protein